MELMEERADALLLSPLGCTFLVLASTSGLSAAEIVEHRTSLYLSAASSDTTTPWRDEYSRLRDEAVRLAREQRDLALAIINEPGAADWFGPMDSTRQVFAQEHGFPALERANYFPRGLPLETWPYAEKLIKSLFTSTFSDNISHITVASDERICDFGVHSDYGKPYPIWRLTPDPASRVYEITGPQSWHDLAARYPTAGMVGNTPPHTQEPGRITPDWHAVSADWEAVHMTFGGLLTTDQVLVRSKTGWTYHWSWNVEETLWLRWMFTAVERLPDHEATRVWPMSLSTMSNPIEINVMRQGGQYC